MHDLNYLNIRRKGVHVYVCKEKGINTEIFFKGYYVKVISFDKVDKELIGVNFITLAYEEEIKDKINFYYYNPILIMNKGKFVVIREFIEIPKYTEENCDFKINFSV